MVEKQLTKVTQHTKECRKCTRKVGKSPWRTKYTYTGKSLHRLSSKEKWKLINASTRKFKKTFKKDIDAYDKQWKRIYKKCNKTLHKKLTKRKHVKSSKSSKKSSKQVADKVADKEGP